MKPLPPIKRSFLWTSEESWALFLKGLVLWAFVYELTLLIICGILYVLGWFLQDYLVQDSRSASLLLPLMFLAAGAIEIPPTFGLISRRANHSALRGNRDSVKQVSSNVYLGLLLEGIIGIPALSVIVFIIFVLFRISSLP